jgi:hypothetical protein
MFSLPHVRVWMGGRMDEWTAVTRWPWLLCSFLSLSLSGFYSPISRMYDPTFPSANTKWKHTHASIAIHQVTKRTLLGSYPLTGTAVTTISIYLLQTTISFVNQSVHTWYFRQKLYCDYRSIILLKRTYTHTRTQIHQVEYTFYIVSIYRHHHYQHYYRRQLFLLALVG